MDPVKGLILCILYLVSRTKLPQEGGSCRKPGVLMQGLVSHFHSWLCTGMVSMIMMRYWDLISDILVAVWPALMPERIQYLRAATL